MLSGCAGTTDGSGFLLLNIIRCVKGFANYEGIYRVFERKTGVRSVKSGKLPQNGISMPGEAYFGFTNIIFASAYIAKPRFSLRLGALC
jgi:hypothetical protein